MVSLKHHLNFGPNFSRFKFCNAKLTTNDANKCILVHKVVFAAVSKKFEKWFEENPDMSETFVIPDVKFEILEIIVDFIYTGQVTFANDGDDAYKNFCVGLVLLKINLCDIETTVNALHYQ